MSSCFIKFVIIILFNEWSGLCSNVTTFRSTTIQALYRNPLRTTTNLTTYNIIDVRTPPRIQIIDKNKHKNHHQQENSHPGEAIPLDANTFVLEDNNNIKKDSNNNNNNNNNTLITVTESDKKSTWILLTGPTTKNSISTTTQTSQTKLQIEESNKVTLEAKDASINLPNEKTTTTKPKTKKKKKNNKNRRRKPTNKSDVSTKNPIIKTTESTLGNQVYNYLSRELVPTLGVGLVGLVVTAGLATYFLYPSPILRRADEVNTNKNHNNYYYKDKYSGGMLEEEAIGEVIAGMPDNLFFSKKRYKPTYKSGSVSENVPFTFDKINEENIQKEEKETVDYINDKTATISKEKDDDNNNNNNIISSVTVPEHGPRNLRSRRHSKIINSLFKQNR